jgi:hypothetical protein
MKIEIEHYDQKYTFESKSDDYTLREVAEIIKYLLHSAGYSLDGINEIILTDE